MGEIVGKAAYVAVLHGTSPRGVYEKHLPELTRLAEQPGAMRRDSLTGEARLDPNIPDPHKLPVGAMNRDLPQFATRLSPGDGAPLEMLPGLVVDDSNAQFSGDWSKTSLTPCIGGGARLAGPKVNGEARFKFSVPTAGKYEVRLYWSGHENRSSKTTCVLERAGQANVTQLLNQRTTAPKGANSLGIFDFAANGENAVVLKTEGADGNVVADAIQVVPVP
jgi:hypothetical protein